MGTEPVDSADPRIASLEAYLHREIPLSQAMGVAVEGIFADHVVLGAPLGPNLNHKSTAFGGSISAVAILAGWALVHLHLKEASLDAELVIQRNEVAYLAPVRAHFLAEARLAGGRDWSDFERRARRGRMARAEVEVTVSAEGRLCASLRGAFVAVPRRSTTASAP